MTPDTRSQAAGPIPILLYHSVGTEALPTIAPFTVSPETFLRHLDLIEEHDCTVLSLSALMDLRHDGCALPARPVVITFDDGFADVLDVAAGALAARRMPSTAYLTTGFLPGAPSPAGLASPGLMLSMNRVPDLEDAGVEVGAHSHTHDQLDLLTPARAAEEIYRSRDLLQDQLGHAIRSFAYPHGYAGRRVCDEVRRAGFDSACGVRNALSTPTDDPYLLARLTVRHDTSVGQMVAWLHGRGPVATPGEKLQTKAWRGARRMRRLANERSGARS